MPTTRLRGSASDPLASECQATADEADYQPHFQPPIAVVSEVIVITPSSARADSNPAQPMEQETAPLSGEPLTAFRRYLWLIRRILMHDHRLSSHDAEDLAQDIFLAMAEGWNRRRQKDEGATIAWIRTIVRHIASIMAASPSGGHGPASSKSCSSRSWCKGAGSQRLIG